MGAFGEILPQQVLEIKKKTKRKFNKVVREAIEFVSLKNIINFAARYRRDMMAFMDMKKTQFTYLQLYWMLHEDAEDSPQYCGSREGIYPGNVTRQHLIVM